VTADFPDRTLDADDPAAPIVATSSPSAASDAPVTNTNTAATRQAHAPATGETAGNRQDDVELVPAGRRTEFESRWREIQATFVDDPRRAVNEADALVAEVAQALTASFSERKSALERHAGSGGDTQTEELRQALRSYRALFERVLRI